MVDILWFTDTLLFKLLFTRKVLGIDQQFDKQIINN